MSILSTSNSVTAGEIACRILQNGAAQEVIGVFSQGIYTRAGEEVLLLHDAKWGSVPFGIALPDFAAFAANAALAVGDGFALSMPITCASGAYPTAESLSKERVAAVDAYIRAHGSEGGMLALLAENRGKVREKIEGLLSGDVDSALGLVGLGRGLTPSGDDFLCGFFCMLRAAGDTRFDAVRDAVLQNLHRTTSISAAYLQSALSGEYFTVYDRALRAVMEENFAPHCDFVLGMGASSGTDTMLGVLAAASVLLSRV